MNVRARNGSSPRIRNPSGAGGAPLPADGSGADSDGRAELSVLAEAAGWSASDFTGLHFGARSSSGPCAGQSGSPAEAKRTSSSTAGTRNIWF